MSTSASRRWWPLTGRACVDRIIADLGVLDVVEGGAGLEVVDTAPGVTEAEPRIA